MQPRKRRDAAGMGPARAHVAHRCRHDRRRARTNALAVTAHSRPLAPAACKCLPQAHPQAAHACGKKRCAGARASLLQAVRYHGRGYPDALPRSKQLHHIDVRVEAVVRGALARHGVSPNLTNPAVDALLLRTSVRLASALTAVGAVPVAVPARCGAVHAGVACAGFHGSGGGDARAQCPFYHLFAVEPGGHQAHREKDGCLCTSVVCVCARMSGCVR